MKKFILLSVLFCCISFGIKSQDASFLNYNQSLLLLNPSFAGSNGNWRFQSNYGNINPNLVYSQISSFASIDAFIKPIHGAIALSYLGDNFSRGLLKDQRMNLCYAQHFTIGEKKIKLIPSFEFTYIQRKIDATQMIFEDGARAVQFNYEPSGIKRNLILSTGLLMNYKNFYGGFSLKNFNQPDIGISSTNKLPISINIHTSYTKSFNDKSFVQFFALYNHQGSNNTITLNTNALLMKHLIVGLGFNSYSQTSISFGYRNHIISSVFSYGKDFSRLAVTPNNSIDLSLAIALRNKAQTNWINNFEKW